MRRTLTAAIVSAALLFTVASCKQGKPVNFAGGFEGGTYYEIANSLNTLADYNFNVSTSNGSFDNLIAISEGRAEYTITQLDMLQSFMVTDPAIAEQAGIMMPLYTEEVHLVARREIQTMSDLAGKRVSFGHMYSGSKITSLIFLNELGIGQATLTIEDISSEAAVEKLLAGELDAILIVVGRPAKIFEDIPASEMENIHLLEFTGTFYDQIQSSNYTYQQSEIPMGTYPWQDEAVKTLGVQSVLLASNALDAGEVAALANSIYDNQSSLASAHEKWNFLSKDELSKLYDNLPDLFHAGMADITDN